MSALDHKQIFSEVCAMSALPPKADIVQHDRDVRFVPKADIMQCSNFVVAKSKSAQQSHGQWVRTKG